MRLQLDAFRELLKDAGSILNECACSFCTFHCGAAAREAAGKETFEKVNYPPESMPRLMEAMLCCKESPCGLALASKASSSTCSRAAEKFSVISWPAAAGAAGWRAGGRLAGRRLAGGWRAAGAQLVGV